MGVRARKRRSRTANGARYETKGGAHASADPACASRWRRGRRAEPTHQGHATRTRMSWFPNTEERSFLSEAPMVACCSSAALLLSARLPPEFRLRVSNLTNCARRGGSGEGLGKCRVITIIRSGSCIIRALDRMTPKGRVDRSITKGIRPRTTPRNNARTPRVQTRVGLGSITWVRRTRSSAS